MNRILAFLRPRSCQCCSELHDLERRLDLAAAEAERIEIAAGDGVLEFWIPDAARLLKAADDEDRGIRLLIGVDARHASLDESLTTYCVTELRRIAGELVAAADRIEGSVSA